MPTEERIGSQRDSYPWSGKTRPGIFQTRRVQYTPGLGFDESIAAAAAIDLRADPPGPH